MPVQKEKKRNMSRKKKGKNRPAGQNKPAAAPVNTPAEKKARFDKRSIAVLLVSAAVFFSVLFWIHSEEILNGSGKLFWEYGDETIDFDTAKITAVTKSELEVDEKADGAYTGTQEIRVIVKSGRYKGEEMTAYNYIGPLSGVPLSVGDNVTLTIKTHNDGRHSATVYEFNRIPILAVFLLVFFVLIVVIGGRTGLKSLAGLVFTFICLFLILIPLLLKGAPTVLTTFLTCAFIALVSFTILGGIHRKTVSAFLGTVAGAFLAMIFAMAVQYFAKINGMRLEDVEPLLQLRYYSGAVIRLKGLLTAGIIISALGAVMDVAMSISSALEEVHAANPDLSAKELFRSGMNIGRDMVGTMTNTLILAFLGSEFTLMIFLYARELTFFHMYSTAFVALETISGVSASIGMILAIPLTALISSTLISGKRG